MLLDFEDPDCRLLLSVSVLTSFCTLGAAPLFQREPQTVLGLSVPQKQGLQR